MPPPPPPADGSSPGAAAWSASAHNPWLALVLVLVIGHGAVANLLLRSSAAAYLNAAHLLVLLLLLELFSRIRVSVDARELRISYGHLGWLRQRIDLRRVESARCSHLEPMEHGGFGYRGSLRFSGRAALVVRAGPALALALDGGKQLSISVDDAERGARVITSLVARRRPAPTPARTPAPS